MGQEGNDDDGDNDDGGGGGGGDDQMEIAWITITQIPSYMCYLRCLFQDPNLWLFGIKHQSNVTLQLIL